MRVGWNCNRIDQRANAHPPPVPPILLRATIASTASPSNITGAPGASRLNEVSARLATRLSAANVPHIRHGAITITAAPLRSAARAIRSDEA